MIEKDKKNKKNKKKKKAFTLIELLAVIIILGILMIIAIPSVTNYINESRKNTYADTVKELIKGASTKVNSGEYNMNDKETTYYIPFSAIETENGKAKSPYGDFDEAYIAVTLNDNDEYDYYFVGKDSTGMGINELTEGSKIDSNSIKSGIDDIDTSYAIGNDKYVVIFNNDGTSGDPTNAKYKDTINTVLKPGKQINILMKSLAKGKTVSGSSVADTKITRIKMSETEPTEENKESKNLASVEGQEYPVYMWFEPETGILWWWSEDKMPTLNEVCEFMFYALEALTEIENFENFNSSNVIDMDSMFAHDKKLVTINLSNFDTSSAQTFRWLFNNDSSLTSLDVSKFDTSNVINMDSMFRWCSKLTTLDVSNFDTSKVETMEGMFSNCQRLTSIDISHFNTSSLIDMSSMFSNCKALVSADLSGLDLSSVEYIYCLFYWCNKLTTINLNVSKPCKVIDASGMFGGCWELVTVDISKLDFSEVEDITDMFEDDKLLTTIYVSNTFSNESIESATSAFSKCYKLKGGAGTSWTDAMKSDETKAHVDGGTSNPGLFTLKV